MVPRTYTYYSSALFQSCKKLMNQPVSMSCGHSAFKTCLQEMIFKQNTGSRPWTRPHCRVRIEGDRLNVNFIVSVLIGRIQVRCTNVGCSWIGRHSEKEKCIGTFPFIILDCINGPNVYLEKPEVCDGPAIRILTLRKRHVQSLPQGVETFTLDSRVKYCPEDPRSCPLQCGAQLPRSVLYDSQKHTIHV